MKMNKITINGIEYIPAAEVTQQVRGDVKPVAWMGVDSEGNPNKFRLNFFSGGIPLFASREDMELIETTEKNGSPCPEFWDWLPRAYNFNGDGSFTKYNMEVAFSAGKNSTTNHATDVLLQLVDALQVAVDSDLGVLWLWPESAKETWLKNANAALAAAEIGKRMESKDE